MELRNLLGKLNQIESQVEEGGCGAPISASPPVDNEPKPSISININAQGTQGIQDILKLLSSMESDKGDDMPVMAISKPAQSLDIGMEKEAYENEPDEEEKDLDYLLNKVSDGMNRKKGTYPPVSHGDNPMQKIRTAENLEDQIRAELRKKLAEAKGAK